MKTVAPSTAWLRVLTMIVVLWLLPGALGFGFFAQYIADRFQSDLVLGAFVLDLVFAVIIAIIVGGIVAWQRAHSETLADLGWRKPTQRVAVMGGVVLGLAWVALSYARGGSPWAAPWERPVMAVIGSFLAFGEELAVRGFLMEQLRRGGVATWPEVLVSAVVMGG